MADRGLGFGIAVLGAALLACANGVGGRGADRDTTKFDEWGFVHAEYAYRIVHRDEANGSVTQGLMDAAWLFDNIYSKDDQLRAKQTPEYTTKFEMDADGDGNVDFTETALLYDVRFKHRSHDAVIFVRSVPIPSDLAQKDLRVLVQRYIDEVSGAGYEAVQIRGVNKVAEQRFAAELRDRGPGRVAGQEAYQATFDVANVDQLRVSPTARRTRVRIVFVRTPFMHESVAERAWKKHQFPVVLVAGYANLPEDFERDLPAFGDLLGRIKIGDAYGYEPGPQESVGVAAAAPPTNAASAPLPTPAPEPSAAPTPTPAASAGSF